MNEVFAIQPVERQDVITSSTNLQEFEDWYFSFYGLNEMHERGYRGQGVKVGVGDTGVPRHEDINVFWARDGRTTHHPTHGEGMYDYEGHSTHVSGIIAAQHNGKGTKGVAPDSQLHVVKVLGDTGAGTVMDIIAGGYMAAIEGVKLFNLSLGMNGIDERLRKAINDWYHNYGMVCICAAGNDGGDNDLDYPGRDPLTICVGSHDKYGSRSVFSDKGPMLDVYGAGEKILSTVGIDNYQVMSGTSMAAPFITGLLACYYDAIVQKYGVFTIEIIEDFITAELIL